MLNKRCSKCGGNLFVDFGVSYILPTEVRCLQCGKTLDSKEAKSILKEYNESYHQKTTRV